MPMSSQSSAARRERQQRGQGLVEYALIAGFVGLVAIVVLMLIGSKVSGALCTTNAGLQGVTNAGCYMYETGDNSFGVLGIGNTSNPNKFTRNTGAKPVAVVSSTGSYHDSVLVMADGSVETTGAGWAGQNASGGSYSGYTSFTVNAALSHIIQASGGGDSFCAVDSAGKVWTWGDNTQGQLGNGSNTGNSDTPVNPSGLTGVFTNCTMSSVGGFAVRNDGTLWGWGTNANYQLGNGTTTPNYTPSQIGGVSGIVQVSDEQTSAAVLALKSDGTVWSWGASWSWIGRGGDNTHAGQITGVPAMKWIKKTGDDAFMITTAGALWDWGPNSSGGLMDGTTTDVSTPEANPYFTLNVSSAYSTSTGPAVAVALSTGQVYVAGSNANGELGQGGTDSLAHMAPIQVAGNGNGFVGGGYDTFLYVTKS